MSENKRDSFIFYRSFKSALSKINDEKTKLKCYEILVDFALEEKEPSETELNNPFVNMYYEFIKPQIKANKTKYLSGCKGGRPKKKKTEPKPMVIDEKNQNETEPKPMVIKDGNLDETKTKPNDNVNGNENENLINENLKDFIPPCIPPLKEGNEKTEDKPTEKTQDKSKRFVKPHIDEINAFCDENDIVIDAEAFYDYFESKGWTVGKAPMKDWRAAVRNWYRRQSPETTAKLEKKNNQTDWAEILRVAEQKRLAAQAAQKESEPITGQQKADLNQITNSLFKSPDAGKPAANDDFNGKPFPF